MELAKETPLLPYPDGPALLVRAYDIEISRVFIRELTNEKHAETMGQVLEPIYARAGWTWHLPNGDHRPPVAAEITEKIQALRQFARTHQPQIAISGGLTIICAGAHDTLYVDAALIA